jgi:hypothetical protein
LRGGGGGGQTNYRLHLNLSIPLSMLTRNASSFSKSKVILSFFFKSNQSNMFAIAVSSHTTPY